MEYLSTGGYWVVLLAIGAACGLLNTLASSGSAVTLPALVMLGVPEGAANATNRLPVLIGAAMATFSFHRKGALDWSGALKLVPAAVAGSVVGVLVAESLPNRQMGLAITAAVLVALLLLFTKVKEALKKTFLEQPMVTPKALGLIFLVGIWLGFIVLDGATYLLLVLMLVCSYNLLQANALKSVLIAMTTAVPVLMFSGAGQIYWTEGILMSAGSVGGAHLGAQYSAHPRAKQAVYVLLVAVISFELIHLAWHYSAAWRSQ